MYLAIIDSWVNFLVMAWKLHWGQFKLFYKGTSDSVVDSISCMGKTGYPRKICPSGYIFLVNKISLDIISVIKLPCAEYDF